ncbi:MAG TPA: ADP-ribosylglycohydrolase family protein [Candidatus Obscuribacterales bacterium]
MSDTPIHQNTAERIAGGLWGLLVGDALGVPYEFHEPEAIPGPEQIEFVPPAGFKRAHTGTAPGTWSDDGAHALCLLASLLEKGRLDPEDLMTRLSQWYETGYLAVDGKVFDVGIQTTRALQAFRKGTPALEAGPCGSGDNGNGSLMRVLPLALWHQGSDAELVAAARLQSRVTHGHLRAQLCCALYCLWARHILANAPDPWAAAVTTLRELCPEGSPEQAELEFYLRPDEDLPGKGTGYVVDCLRSARQVLRLGDYETVVKSAIRLGHDTDTTACVTGGLAGLRDGIEGIPARWRQALRGQELFQPLLEALLDLRSRE